MEPRRSPFLEKLMTYLSYIEIGGLIVSSLGLTFLYMNLTSSRQLILLGLTSLSGIYFLSAFTIPSDPGAGTEAEAPKGPLDLFFQTIVRKVIYIGCSISVIGLLFGLLGLRGGGQLLLIGGTALVISCLLSGLAIVRNNKLRPFLEGPLTRAVPIAILAMYWLYKHWPLQD